MRGKGSLNRYIKFIKKIGKYNIPLMRFLLDLEEDYRYLYEKLYSVTEEQVGKATFIVFCFIFLFSFIPFFLITFILIGMISSSFFIILLLLLTLSMILSTVVAYFFNTILFRRIRSDEKSINALIYLLRINFSLFKLVGDKSDLGIIFTKLIIQFKLPISHRFKEIFSKMLIGHSLENQLKLLITPSLDFNYYIKDLLLSNFSIDERYFDESKEEKHFKKVIRNLKVKLGIMFFIGFFFPIILCVIILFELIPLVYSIFLLPFIILCLFFLYQKLIKNNSSLIGVVDGFNLYEKQKFIEFLKFLETLAAFLLKKSPELSFAEACFAIKPRFKVLKKILSYQTARLLSLQVTLKNMIKSLKTELEDNRYSILMNIIYKMMIKSSKGTSDKIRDILIILRRHKNLEERFSEIIKSNKIIALLLVFLFPIILGAIGGFLPLFMAAIEILRESDILALNSYTKISFFELIKINDVIMTFVILLACTLITSYFFMKIVRYKRFKIILFLTCFIFIVSFLVILFFTFNLEEIYV